MAKKPLTNRPASMPAGALPGEASQESFGDMLRWLWYSQWRWAIVGGFAVLLALLGWGIYDRWQGVRADAASSLHSQLERSLDALNKNGDENALDEARDVVARLRKKHADSIYAVYGMLMWGAKLVENGELAAAEEAFLWVSNRAQDFDLKAIAGLHRAKVVAARGDYEEALDIISSTDSDIVAPAFRETQGDIAWSRGKLKNALKLYTEAWQMYRNFPPPQSLRFKIQELQSRVNTAKSDG